MSNPVRIEAGTDVAMIGLWDVSTDADPMAKRPSIPELEAESASGRLLLIKTWGDGSYEGDFYVGEEVPPVVLEDFVPMADWRLIHTPSGALCFGGVEDYRAPKKQITGADSIIGVVPGDHRVRAYVVDFDKPERQLAESIGVEDYEYWRPIADGIGNYCCGIVLVVLASIAMSIWISWWLGPVATALALVAWLPGYRRAQSDPRYLAIDERVTAEMGEDSIEDRQERFLAERPTLVFVLQKLAPGEAAPSAGFVETYPATRSTEE